MVNFHKEYTLENAVSGSALLTVPLATGLVGDCLKRSPCSSSSEPVGVEGWEKTGKGNDIERHDTSPM